MDNYQAVYDAVRSAFDMGNLRQVLFDECIAAAREPGRPVVVFKPALSKDGDKWCYLLGENLMEGIAGFGSTVSEAATAFDQAFYSERPAS